MYISVKNLMEAQKLDFWQKTYLLYISQKVPWLNQKRKIYALGVDFAQTTEYDI